MSFIPIQDVLEGNTSRTLARFSGIHTGFGLVDEPESFARTSDLDHADKLELRPGLKKNATTGEIATIRGIEEIELGGQRFIGILRNGIMMLKDVKEYITVLLISLCLMSSAQAYTMYTFPLNYPLRLDQLNNNFSNLYVDVTFMTNFYAVTWPASTNTFLRTNDTRNATLDKLVHGSNWWVNADGHLGIGTNNPWGGMIQLPESTSTNGGLRFGDDVWMYRGATAFYFISPVDYFFYSQSGFCGALYAPYLGDLSFGLYGTDSKIFQWRNGSKDTWMSMTNDNGTVTLRSGKSSSTTNALLIGAGTNRLTIGEGGPVYITNAVDPVSAQDVVTLAYLQDITNGLVSTNGIAQNSTNAWTTSGWIDIAAMLGGSSGSATQGLQSVLDVGNTATQKMTVSDGWDGTTTWASTVRFDGSNADQVVLQIVSSNNAPSLNVDNYSTDVGARGVSATMYNPQADSIAWQGVVNGGDETAVGVEGYIDGGVGAGVHGYSSGGIGGVFDGSVTGLWVKTGVLDMNTRKMINVGDPTDAQDAVTLAYLRVVTNSLVSTNDTRLLDFSGIVRGAVPIGTNDLVNKQYFDLRFEELFPETCFFTSATNIHPIAVTNLYAATTYQTNAFNLTNAMSAGAVKIGTWACTNTIGVTNIPAGTIYEVHLHGEASRSGVITGEGYARLGIGTGMNYRIALESAPNTIQLYDNDHELHIHTATNIATLTTEYKFIEIWATNVGAGTLTWITKYGGNYDSHISGPTLNPVGGGGSSGGNFSTPSTVNCEISNAIPTLSLRQTNLQDAAYIYRSNDTFNVDMRVQDGYAPTYWTDPYTNILGARYDFETTNATGESLDWHNPTNNMIPIPAFATGPQWTFNQTNGYGRQDHQYNFSGNAAHFDNKTITNQLQYAASGAISAWVMFTNAPAANRWRLISGFSKAGASGGNYAYQALGFYNTAGDIAQWRGNQFVENSGTLAWDANVAFTLQLNVWYHIVWGSDGVSPYLYTNGAPASLTFTVTTDKTKWWNDQISSATKADTFSLGGVDYDNIHTNFFEGRMAVVKIYTNNITGLAITNLYLQTKPNNNQELNAVTPATATNTYTAKPFSFGPADSGTINGNAYVGDGTGNVYLNALNQYFQIAGVNVLTLNSSVFAPATAHFFDFGTAALPIHNIYVDHIGTGVTDTAGNPYVVQATLDASTNVVEKSITNGTWDADDRVIPNCLLVGQLGASLAGNYGPAWTCFFADADAQFKSQMFCRRGGTYKVAMLWSSSVAGNGGKTMSGMLYVSTNSLMGEAQSWNVFANNWDLPIPNAAEGCTNSIYSTSFVVAPNSEVKAAYVKDDTAGGAAGSVLIDSFFLIRQ